jgi:hypothetical protein
MSDTAYSFLNSAPLAGARIWLSGAIPEAEVTDEAQRDAILGFVRQFAREVFARGGYILHGSHPSFTPTLLEEAKSHQDRGGRKDCLILAVSRHWSKHTRDLPLDQWRNTAIVYETPEVTGDEARDASLALLRQWIAARSDAVVVAGGKWWHSVAGRSGVPIELALAMERGLPCFLLGGLGGAAREFITQHPELLDQLRNGLDGAANHELSTSENVADLAVQVCRHLERLPLVRGRSTDGVSFRILALDGGGLKGAFTAAALACWEKHTGRRIVDHFDLVAGTSTGGILAIGLGLGLSAEQMLEFYMKRGPVIFPVTRFRSRIWHVLRHLYRPKYSQTLLLRELEDAYYSGGRPLLMNDSQCRLVVPAYHAVAGASHVFRTPHHPDLTTDANTQAAHAALATAAAPTFFTAAKVHSMVTQSSYFDGGVWATSPTMAAIIEAVCFLRIPLERLDVLSVGTTDEPFTVSNQTRAGILGWIWRKRILDLLMSVQQESSLKLSRQLTTASRFLRVNVSTVPGKYRLDSPREIEQLAALGESRALDTEILGQVKSRFLNGVHVTPWDRYA